MFRGTPCMKAYKSFTKFVAKNFKTNICSQYFEDEKDERKMNYLHNKVKYTKKLKHISTHAVLGSEEICPPKRKSFKSFLTKELSLCHKL